jgi:hypothetical protein
VLQNDVVFGTVSANRHQRPAARDWLERLITRGVPLDRYAEALHRREDDIKVVLDIAR